MLHNINKSSPFLSKHGVQLLVQGLVISIRNTKTPSWVQIHSSSIVARSELYQNCVSCVWSGFQEGRSPGTGLGNPALVVMYTNCCCITIGGCTNMRLRSFGYSFTPLLSLPLFEALKEWLAFLIVLSCSGSLTAIGSRVGSSLSPEEHRCLNWTQEKEINTSTWNLPTEASTPPFS